jgi:hypothetical protein
VLESVEITDSASTLKIGKQLQLTAIGHYSNRQTLDLTNSIVWASNNIGATVSQAGLVSGAGIGLVHISATFLTLAATLALTVTGGDLMLSARYTVTAGDVAAGGDNLTIPLNHTEDDAAYGAIAEVATGDQSIICQVPIAGRTTTQVNVLSSAPLQENDIVEIFIARVP